MFLSCPLLEKFEIKGDVSTNYVGGIGLRFNFVLLEHLKSIKVDIGGISHYKLGVPGKENQDWRNLDVTRPPPVPNTAAVSIYIELTWLQNTVTTIKLRDTL